MDVQFTGDARDLPQVVGKPHVLGDNPASPRPSNLLFLDTETEVATRLPGRDLHRFRLGVTCYYQRRPGAEQDTEVWGYHRSVEGVLDEIERRTRSKTSLFVFASNPGFDLWVIKFYYEMAERGWQASFVYDEGTTFILVCRRESARIKVLALQNFYYGGIEGVGRQLGKPKLDTDPLAASESEVWTYCRRDVEILRDAVLEYVDFLDRHDTGGFALTRNGQSFRWFRHRYLKHRVWVHREVEALEIERRAYFGGRTEAWRKGPVGGGPFVCLDVNSLYPFVMHRYPYPVNLKGIIRAPTLRQVEKALERYCLCAEVELDTDLPLWAKRMEGRTCFPTGRFTAYVCSLGLAMAVKTGALRQVRRMVLYKRAHLFRDFVRDVYSLRKDYRRAGNEPWQQICKYMLNGLYGKFGQANPVVVKETETDSPGFFRESHITLEPGRQRQVTQLMHKIWIEEGREEDRHSLPSICAHVTEYGRFYLAHLISMVGWDRVLYCDTDSLIIRAGDQRRLSDYLSPVELGGLDVEGEFDSLTIHGLKDYLRDGQQTIKGVPQGAVEVDPGRYECTVFPGTKSLLQDPHGVEIPQDTVGMFEVQDILDLQKMGLYPVIRRVKELQRDYKKGVVGPDGVIKPHHLG